MTGLSSRGSDRIQNSTCKRANRHQAGAGARTPAPDQHADPRRGDRHRLHLAFLFRAELPAAVRPPAIRGTPHDVLRGRVVRHGFRLISAFDRRELSLLREGVEGTHSRLRGEGRYYGQPAFFNSSANSAAHCGLRNLSGVKASPEGFSISRICSVHDLASSMRSSRTWQQASVS